MRNLIPHFIQEQLLQSNRRGRFQAYTMYIDLSGFTPLTETLMKRGNAGAEQLSLILNNIFGLMVEVVYQQKGFIPYFAGDAITAIFPVHDTDISALSLLHSAQQLESLFTDKNRRKTQFGDFEIGIKIRLSHGAVEWGIVGNKLKSFYFRGPAIDQPSLPNAVSEEQGILFDEYLRSQFLDTEVPEIQQVNNDFYRLRGQLQDTPLTPTDHSLPSLQRQVLSQFLPDSILDFNQEGEFREVLSLFITFKGIENHEMMNRFASIALDLVDNFSGYFKEIDFGDKGGMMVIFFGAPVSYENNIDRALEFISVLQKETQELQSQSALQFRAGISTGMAFTGFVGGEERCQYAAVGNLVNLAARLMTQANWGFIRVDESIARSKNFDFTLIGNTRYKGIEGSIPTYEMTGRRVEDQTGFTNKMIGRSQEQKQLLDLAQPIFEGRFAGIACLYGEAGIGKSRLAYEIKKALTQKGDLQWLNCPADQILRKPFNPFVSFLKGYFKQEPDHSNTANKKIFEDQYRNLLHHLKLLDQPEATAIHKELMRTQSILAALISIPYSNSLWSQLDAKGRYQNTLEALSALIIGESLLQPIVLELEDGHWFDKSSKDFLVKLVSRISRYPIFILITSRYLDDASKPQLIAQEVIDKNHIEQFDVDLNILSKTDLQQFSESMLGGRVSQDLLALLQRSTNGNPFYLEQILEYFMESQLLKKENQEWLIKDPNVKISGSISSILMARIDRLSVLVKETVKAAAVIGREFDIPVLSEIMKTNKEFARFNGKRNSILREQVQSAERVQIWLAMNELRYIFRHSLLRETVYSMQMGTRLRELHGLIGNAIERLHTDKLESKYVDLAFHFEQAKQEEKAAEYLEKAANHARSNFQNDQALQCYTRLLPKIKDEKIRSEILLQKAKVLELIGEWEQCGTDLSLALKLAHEADHQLLTGRVNNRLGRISMLRGDYVHAQKYLEIARQIFEQISDHIGIAKVNGNLGNLYFRQGDYLKANDFFYKSLEYSRPGQRNISNANIVAHLGLAYMNQGKFEEGIRVQLQELENCNRRNDKQGLATLYTNMGIVYFEKGDYDKSLISYQKGLSYAQELGNKQLTAIAIGCIGSVYQQQGNYAKALENFLTDLKVCEEMGDKQGIAIALGLLGELRAVEGEFDLAKQYLEKAIMLSSELNYQKGIAKSANNLGDIYTFQKNYQKAIYYYDQAIEIARRINNQLVLGFSLVEKSEVYEKMGKAEEALKIQDETNAIAESLGNPDLLFQALLLKARLSNHTKSTSEARNILLPLLYDDIDVEHQAAIYFELFQMTPDIEDYRETALRLYQQLYKDTPKFSFYERIKILEQIKD